MNYVKTIQQTGTGMVIAEVFDSKGNRVGLEFFEWPPFLQETRLKRAHSWADKWIANCTKYCTPQEAAEVKS